MKITFGMIVIDGMPFIKHQLSLLYPIAHQIIICEGAVDIWANLFGERRSTDGTIEFIKSFPDPDNKISLIQKDWKNKNYMAYEYSKIATGDFIWHIDVDEFFDPNKASHVLSEMDKNTNMIRFGHAYFFGDTDTVVEGKRRKWEQNWYQPVRLYKRLEGLYVCHLPNNAYFDPRRPVRKRLIARWKSKLSRKLRIFHFASNVKEHVRQKMEYYAARDPGSIKEDWYENVFLKFRENRDKWIKGGFDVSVLQPRRGVRAKRLAELHGKIPDALAPLVEELND